MKANLYSIQRGKKQDVIKLIPLLKNYGATGILEHDIRKVLL